ncbi:MAG: peptide-methionine (S)-S-oxide reductase MsrA [Candidatus Eutrophobiaceae bacterium]
MPLRHIPYILCLGILSLGISTMNQAAEPQYQKATFAGGCFWCMEPPFDKLEGVTSTVSGYSGGHTDKPSYESTSSGSTGHAEVVQITFDPAKISYEQLLDVFWRNIDPTTPNRQFCDIGTQYRSAIFYHDEAQKRAAEQSLHKLRENKPFKEDIITELSPLKNFYPAEDYHQNYYQINPVRYKYYRWGCGRDKRLEELWGEE